MELIVVVVVVVVVVIIIIIIIIPNLSLEYSTKVWESLLNNGLTWN
jgi:hypothetical protein